MRKTSFLKAIVAVILLTGCMLEGASQNIVKPTVKAPNGFDVNSFTGNLYHQRTDMKMPAQGIPMEIVFSYNNTQRSKEWGYGPGWTFTYNVAYTVDSVGNITVLRADGRRDLFRKAGAAWKAPVGAFDTLAEYQAGKFRLNTKGGWTYYFDVASHRKLTKVQDRNNNAITISYTDSLPSAITDAAGRSFALTWDNGKLKEIQNTCSAPVRKIVYTYDTSGNPVKVMRPDSSALQYYYDDNSRIIGFTDELGNNMSITYNGNGAVSKIVSCATTQLFTYSPTTRKTFVTEQVQGQRQITTYSYDTTGRIIHKEGNCCGYNVAYQYDTDNNISAQTNGNNQTTQYIYDSKGNVVKETDAEGYTMSYTWHPTLNKVLTVKDKRGNTTNYEYDASGNLTKIIKPLGITEVFTYDSKGNILSYKDGNNNLTIYEYNTYGQLTKITDALNGVVTNTYNGCGNLAQVKDARNNVTSYEYDLQNRVTKITDALGGVTKYTFDASGNLSSLTDALNRTTTYVYDGLGRRIKTVSPSGHTVSVEYDERGNKIKVTDARGNSTSYTYNSRNQVLTERDALGKTRSFDYDGVGNLISETNKKGYSMRSEYDKNNRIIKVTNPKGDVSTVSYDANGNKTSVIDYNGNSIYCTYDELNRLIQISDPFNKTIRYTYDARGNVIAQKDKNDKNWTIEYDKLNRKIKNTDPLGHSTEFTYDANGNQITVKNQSGHTTTNTYDALNRPLTEINPLHEVTTYTYNPVGNLQTIQSPNGNIFTNTYNNESRVIATSDNIGPIATYTYDNNGNILTEKDANNNITTYQFDELNRIIGITDALGNKAIKQYDAIGNMLVETDRNNNSKRFEYDQLGRTIKETDALNNSTQFEYDANGNRLRIIDAKNNITSFSYDALNRLIRETFADGSRKEYTYDPNGNKKTRKDNNGVTTSYTYDAINQLIQRSYPGGNNETFTYSAEGLKLTANNNNATIAFTYDNIGRLLTETLNGKTTTYSYNTSARIKTITYPGGKTITESRDTRERLSNLLESANMLAQFDFDGADRLTTKTLGNGVTQHYEYDANNRITTLSCLPNNVFNFEYKYDKEGNRITALKYHNPAYSEQYKYDQTYQLINYYTGTLNNETLSDTTSKNIYSYDALHNRINSIEDNRNSFYTVNNMNEYTRITTNGIPANYTYNVNGSIITDGTNTYQYDNENKLTSISGQAEHAYDALGRRIKSSINGTDTHFYYAGNQIVEEHDNASNIQKTYIYGAEIDHLIAYIAGSQTYFVSNNEKGNLYAVFNGSSVIEKYDYTPFGKIFYYNSGNQPLPNSGIDNKVGFNGRQFINSQTIDFRSRSYSNIQGRFLQRDIAGYTDGYNLYAAYFIPNHTDPFGTSKNGTEVGLEISNHAYTGFGGGWSVEVNYESEDCCKDKQLIPGGNREVKLGLHIEGGIGISGKIGFKVKGLHTNLELGYKHAFLNYNMDFTLKNKDCGGPLNSTKQCFKFAINLGPSYSASVFPIDLSIDLFFEGSFNFCVTSEPGWVELSSAFCGRIGGEFNYSLAKSFADFFDISLSSSNKEFDFLNGCKKIEALSSKINF